MEADFEGYVGRKFALQTNEGNVFRVGKILSDYNFMGKKYFKVCSNRITGKMNLYYYPVSLAYLHRKNIMFLPSSFRLKYKKLVHYDKNGKVLLNGQTHLSVRSRRLGFEY